MKDGIYRIIDGQSSLIANAINPDWNQTDSGAPDFIKNKPVIPTAYNHPDTHPASMIAQDANNRFVTDSEKTTWNNKANASHGNHVPSNGTAGQFLAHDNIFRALPALPIPSIPLATTETDGLMSAEDKWNMSKLENMPHTGYKKDPNSFNPLELYGPGVYVMEWSPSNTDKSISIISYGRAKFLVITNTGYMWHGESSGATGSTQTLPPLGDIKYAILYAWPWPY